MVVFSRDRLLKIVRAGLAASVLSGSMVATARPADDDKQLTRVKGIVGFQTGPAGPLHTIVGKELLPDDDFAVTRDRSAATLVLPDSSIVALGEKTQVKVGAFDQTAAGPGSTITVVNGSLRFDIRRPDGGAANYHFVTATSQIAVRGTVGLLSFLGGNTTVACLVCAADSVTVTVGTQTVALLAGQVLTVSALGTIVTGTITSTALGAFTGAQVSTAAASGSSAATAGVASGAAAGAGAGGAAAGAVAGSAVGTAVGAAAAAAAVGVGISAAVAKPTPTPMPVITPAPTPTPTPVITPTPNANLQVQGVKALPGGGKK